MLNDSRCPAALSIVFDKEWHELPRPAAGAKLVEIRNELREKNLHDTEEPPLEPTTGPISPEVRATRTNDGTYNDLSCPRMGSAGTRFGRNVPLSEAFPDMANLLNPNPRTVSLELLTRTTFQPATILNVLAAAWIQFQVHDWFMHKKGSWTHTHDIPVGDGDTWHESPMRVPKTPADPAKVEGSTRPPAYINENTHWWDGSHVYGSSPSAQASLRAGREGKVLVSPSGRLGVDPVTGVEINGNILDATNGEFGDFTGHLDRHPRVRFVNDEARKIGEDGGLQVVMGICMRNTTRRLEGEEA